MKNTLQAKYFLLYYKSTCGSIAQLGEHLPYKQGVIGSNPIVSTNYRYSTDTPGA